jgi:hypothetical protein
VQATSTIEPRRIAAGCYPSSPGVLVVASTGARPPPRFV